MKRRAAGRAAGFAAVPLLALLLCLGAAAQGESAEGGTYCGNGEAGYVAMYETPGDEVPCRYWVNGEPAEDSAYYVDDLGNTWLFFPEQQGWARTDSLRRLWNKTDFVAAHLDEFVMEEVTLDTGEFEEITFWEYPGCGGTPALVSWYMREDEDTVLKFPAYWADGEGRRWGGYTFLNADGFICLDEPELEENGPDMETVVYPPVGRDMLPQIQPARGKAGGLSPLGRAVLAGCAVPLPVAAAGLVWWQMKKKKRKKIRNG